MDVLVLGAVVVVLTVVVYLLATLGTKETPYEEALAEQRQKQEQEQIALGKTDRQQKYKNTKVCGKCLFYGFSKCKTSTLRIFVCCVMFLKLIFCIQKYMQYCFPFQIVMN